MKRYYFEVVNISDVSQLVTIYAEFKGKFISLYGPFDTFDEDEAFMLVVKAGEMEAAGYTYVKQSDL